MRLRRAVYGMEKKEKRKKRERLAEHVQTRGENKRIEKEKKWLAIVSRKLVKKTNGRVQY